MKGQNTYKHLDGSLVCGECEKDIEKCECLVRCPHCKIWFAPVTHKPKEKIKD